MRTTTAWPDTSGVATFAITGFLALILLSGCGLAMDDEDRLLRGEKSLANGDVRAAVIDAKNVLLDDPDNLRARLLLGRASIAAGDGAAAEKELRRAIRLGAEKTKVAADFAKALLMQQKYREILDEVPVEGLASVDDEATVRRIHGDAYLALNQPEKARRLYASALDLNIHGLDARLGLVSSYIAEGNLEQARSALENATAAHADDPRAWLFSGSFNTRMSEYEASEASFRAALRLADSRADNASSHLALAGLAESLLEQLKTHEARSHVDRLRSEAPEWYQTRLLSARIAYLDRDWVTAQTNLHRVLKDFPDHHPAQLLLGAVHLLSGHPAQAEMYLSSVVAALPDDVQARQLLAEARLRMRKSERAEEALAPIIASPNADSVSLHMAARASLGQRDADKAIDLLRRSVEQDAENVGLQAQLAATLWRVGRKSEARSILERILGEGVDAVVEDVSSAAAVGMLKAESGDIDTAISIAERLQERHPDDPAAHAYAGEIHMMRRDLVAADDSYDRAMSLGPVRGYALRSYQIKRQLGLAGAQQPLVEFLDKHPLDKAVSMVLAEAYLQNGDLDKSVSTYERILSTDTDNAILLNNLAWAYFLTGDPRSIETARKARDLMPQNGAIVDTLGWIMIQQGAVAEGEALLREAVAMEDGRAEIRYHHAVALAKLGKNAEARAVLEQLLAGDHAFAGRKDAEKLFAEL